MTAVASFRLPIQGLMAVGQVRSLSPGTFPCFVHAPLSVVTLVGAVLPSFYLVFPRLRTLLQIMATAFGLSLVTLFHLQCGSAFAERVP
jgi:hypothetical protein